MSSVFNKDFILLTVANLVMAIAFYFMTPVMSLFMTDTFGSGKDEIAYVMFAFTITAILSRPFVGYLLDRVSRYLVYLIAFVAFSLSFVFYPIISSFWLLLVLRFLHGITWGGMNTAAYTLVVDFVPDKHRGLGFGIFGLSMNIAMAVGPLIAIAVSKLAGNYSSVFYSAFGFCALGFLFVLAIPSKKNITNISPSENKFSLDSVFERKAFLVSFNAMLTQIPYGGIIVFILLYARSIGMINGGVFFLILAVGFSVSRVFSGRIYDKFGPKNIIVFGLTLLAFGLLLVGYWSEPIGLKVSAIVLGFGFGVLSPTFQAMVNYNIEPNRRGATNSTYLTFFDTGICIGMILFGAIIPSMGYAATFYISAGIELLALLIFLIFTLPGFKSLQKHLRNS